MPTHLRFIVVLMFLALPLSAQDSEPTVPKETVSVHTVERGNMPLKGRATGSIISLAPNKALMRIIPGFQQQCHSGGISDCLNREHERPGLGEQKPLRLNRLHG
jgi:hypothetical protein